MVADEIEKYVAVGKDLIVCSQNGLNREENFKIRYRIDKENKEIRLFDVPKILTFQEKSIIYYAILDRFYFYPLSAINNDYKDENIEEYIVKENGYTYHEFNNIEGSGYGILGELLFEIPRQRVEVEKLSRIRDIYDMLIRNKKEIGSRPICIAFNGISPDFKDVFKVIKYIFKYDKKLSKYENKIKLYKRSGILGGNKRIFIIPKAVTNIE